MKIRPLCSILAAVALIAPAAPASAGSAATPGSVGSTAHRNNDDAALRAALTAVVDAGATGALALVDDGQKVSTVAVGAARLDPRRPLHVRDQVRVGSITKTGMSTIAFQLGGEGRLRLGGTVGRGVAGAGANGAAITPGMLVQHTPGH